MKTVLLLYDSRTLKSLSCHGGPHPTPNFDRLAERSIQFESHIVGSMPCMPALPITRPSTVGNSSAAMALACYAHGAPREIYARFDLRLPG